MTTLRILGTGSYVPKRVVGNRDFEQIVETSDEWIVTRTGMKERRIADASDPTWYMGYRAAEQALKNAGIEAGELDMIVVSSVSSDFATPALACVIQEKLGAVNSFCFDANVACAGVAVTLDLVWRYMLAGDIKKALIVGAESMSQVTNYEDRGTCVLLGDGSGAIVVESAEGIFGSFVHTDGTGDKHIHALHTRREIPFVKDEPEARLPFEIHFWDTLYMNGRETYKFATKALPEAVEKACAKAGIKVSDLDWVIPHQANLRIIETAAKNFNMPMEKMCVNIDRFGNTSSASMPMALHEAVEAGRIQRGDKICLVGFGAGLIYAATVLEY